MGVYKMKQFFKELFSAYYNSSDGKIYGCEEGSLVYLHEYRHQLQGQWKIFMLILTYFYSLMAGVGISSLILAIEFNSLKYLILGGIAFLPLNFIHIYLEMDSWIYAIIKYYFDKEEKNGTVP